MRCPACNEEMYWRGRANEDWTPKDAGQYYCPDCMTVADVPVDEELRRMRAPRLPGL